MKKSIIMLFIFLSNSLFSQQWTSVYTGYSQDVSDIKFLNADLGYVVLTGSTIRIMKTTNRGTSWQQIFSTGSGSSQGAAIEMLDENTGFLYYDNKILKTTNCFSSTSEVKTFSYHSSYYRIKFANNTTGYVLLSKTQGTSLSIYKTTNSGNSWDATAYNNELQNGFSFAQLTDICFSPSNINIVYVCGKATTLGQVNGYILGKSSDGLATDLNSMSVDNAQQVTNEYLAVVPGTVNDIFVAGNKGLFKSTGSDFTQTFFMNGINTQQGFVFSDNNHGFFANYHSIYYSNNGGYNWTEEQNNANLVRSQMNSFSDFAMTGGSGGNFWLRKFPVNLNINYDWTSSVYGEMTIDNIDGTVPQTYNTNHNQLYLRGGSSLMSIAPFIVSGSDTNARFYYWGGVGNGSFDASEGKVYFVTSGDLNADYKTKLKTNTVTALQNSNQVKVLKDTNGVTNLVYESMGGIFILPLLVLSPTTIIFVNG